MIKRRLTAGGGGFASNRFVKSAPVADDEHLLGRPCDRGVDYRAVKKPVLL